VASNQQGYIVRGLRKRPFGVAAGIREQASHLPEYYALKDKREYQDNQIRLGEGNLQLGQQKMAMEKKQFKKSQAMERDAQDVAKGGMMLKGGIGLAGAGFQAGMFDKRIAELKGQWGGNKQQLATGANMESDAQMEDSARAVNAPRSGQPSAFSRFSSGGWKQGAMGGVTGGLMGAGLAKTAGAKKKWQTMAAGAAGGMFSTWMAGSSNPWSMALGGMLGGGLGALF